jgi:hypothetical protein
MYNNKYFHFLISHSDNIIRLLYMYYLLMMMHVLTLLCEMYSLQMVTLNS